MRLVCDATFFRKRKDKDGLLIFYDVNSDLILWAKFIPSETKAEYLEGINSLIDSGFAIQSTTIDGRSGIARLFSQNGIPTQICQFHVQKRILTRTTLNPKTDCGRELKYIATHFIQEKWDKERFENEILKLLQKHTNFLQERNLKGQYQHRQLRSALHGIKIAMPYLFTCREKAYQKLNIPNTTNHVDGGINTKIKDLVRRHRGMSIARRNKLIVNLMNNLKGTLK